MSTWSIPRGARTVRADRRRGGIVCQSIHLSSICLSIKDQCRRQWTCVSVSDSLTDDDDDDDDDDDCMMCSVPPSTLQ